MRLGKVPEAGWCTWSAGGWEDGGALLSLLGFQSRGFELGYLEKVSEVKDTVHRQSLLHHLCQMVVEKFPETTDLYSEIASITRSAKVRPSPEPTPPPPPPPRGLTSPSSRWTLTSWPTAWCS